MTFIITIDKEDYDEEDVEAILMDTLDHCSLNILEIVEVPISEETND